MKKIKDTPDFVKEEATGALVSTDAPGLRAYRSARMDRRRIKKQQSAIKQLEEKASRVDSLEQRLAEMEKLVNSLISKGKTKQ